MRIDGQAIAAAVEASLAAAIAGQYPEGTTSRPSLHVIFVQGAGADPASPKYIERKRRFAAKLGVDFRVHEFTAPPEGAAGQLLELVSEIELLADRLNRQATPFFPQLPLPGVVRPYTSRIIERMSPSCDVDGLTTVNRDLLLEGQPGAFYPTPVGAVLRILAELYPDTQRTPPQFVTGALPAYVSRELRGKRATIVANGVAFGELLQTVLERGGLAVARKHPGSPDLAATLRQSDLIVSAVGKAEFSIAGEAVQPGATVIDVATRLTPTGLVGDVDLATVEPRAAYVTPVPGGVGPVTVATLFSNLLFLLRWRQRRR